MQQVGVGFVDPNQQPSAFIPVVICGCHLIKSQRLSALVSETARTVQYSLIYE